MITSILGLVDAIFCCGLAIAVLLLRPRMLSQWLFIAGMIVLGAESVFEVIGVEAVSAEDTARWEHMGFLATAFVPGVWLGFSLCYSRGNHRAFLKKWWLTLAVSFVLPLTLVIGFPEFLFRHTMGSESYAGNLVELGWAGFTLNLVCLVGVILVLTNLERTFRASVGTMRWRIKYMILGLAVLFGVRIYAGSQVLLYSAISPTLHTFAVGGLFVACCLIAVSLFRSRLTNVDVYPSHAVLHHSVTALLAGIYLVLVGVFAKVVTALGGDEDFPVKSLLVLVGLVGVTILVLSDRARQQTKRFVSRHFRRPLYDYRKVWSAFTEKTTSLLDEVAFCRAAARLVAENFEVLSVTVWLADDDKDELAFAASTAMSESGVGEAVKPLTEVRDMIQALRDRAHPVDIDHSRESLLEPLRRRTKGYFPEKGGNRVCVPMTSGGELMGVMTLGDRVNGTPFSVQDFDLLKCIGDEAAARLRNIRLSQQLVQAKEMEAFQSVSAFFVHDLKNTASTLSLMLQNMAVHFDDPAFRQDAARGLSKSVEHISALVAELTVLRQRLEPRLVETDLNEVVAAVLADLDRMPDISLIRDLRPLPKILADPDQIQKVVTNLVMNARDAVGGRGEIRVETGQQDDRALLKVADNGCGMDPEFVNRSLFKPFKTTKKKGLGIGMFHTKMIVDAHRGRIEVESEKGVGTTFHVLLPLRASSS